MRRFPVVLALLAAACSGADPAGLTREGVTALNAGKYDEAYAALDKAVRAMDPADPKFAQAAVGRCQALAYSDPAAARRDFLQLAGDHPARIEERDYELVANALRSEKAFDEALAVLEAGMQRFKESPKLQALRDQMGREAEQSGDPEALARLKGLGYIGD
jgi:tetratricopeptide (TPR) repeat protein